MARANRVVHGACATPDLGGLGRRSDSTRPARENRTSASVTTLHYRLTELESMTERPAKKASYVHKIDDWIAEPFNSRSGHVTRRAIEGLGSGRVRAADTTFSRGAVFRLRHAATSRGTPADAAHRRGEKEEKISRWDVAGEGLGGWPGTFVAVKTELVPPDAEDRCRYYQLALGAGGKKRIYYLPTCITW